MEILSYAIEFVVQTGFFLLVLWILIEVFELKYSFPEWPDRQPWRNDFGPIRGVAFFHRYFMQRVALLHR